MSRYIDADALLSRLPDDLPYKSSVKRVLTQALTADVVEVVRCNDCKHFDLSGDDTYCKYHTDNAGGCEFACYVHGDDYCSCGERKELC